jgi:hypothetical protein
MTLSASQRSFVNSITPSAQQYGAQYGIDPNLIVAQAALESAFGTSSVARNNNNLFGVTNHGEGTGYRAYASPSDSIAGYAALLGTNKRYSNVVGASGADAAGAVASDGYATDPNYGSKLASVMGSINGALGSFHLPSLFGSNDGSVPSMQKGVSGNGNTVSPFAAIANFFTAQTGARLVFAFLGVLLILIAVVQKTAKHAAKLAALAA